jgi:hypothetical protein
MAGITRGDGACALIVGSKETQHWLGWRLRGKRRKGREEGNLLLWFYGGGILVTHRLPRGEDSAGLIIGSGSKWKAYLVGCASEGKVDEKCVCSIGRAYWPFSYYQIHPGISRKKYTESAH